MWLTALSSILVMFVIIFECTPFGTNIETDNPRLIHCMPINVVPISIAIYGFISIVVDLGYALLPAWMLWGVQMTKKSKFGAGFLMSMGLVATGVVVWRMVAFAETGFRHLEKLSMNDGYQLKILVLISCIFETSLGIQSACIATLVPMFRKIRDTYRSFFHVDYSSKSKSQSNPTRSGTARTTASDGGLLSPGPFLHHPNPLARNPPNAFMRREAEYRLREAEFHHREAEFHQLDELERASPSAPASPKSMRRILSSESPRGSIPASPNPRIRIPEPESPHSPVSTRSSDVEYYYQTLPTIHSGEVLPSSETVSTMMSIPISAYGSLELPGTLTESNSRINIASPSTHTTRSMD